MRNGEFMNQYGESVMRTKQLLCLAGMIFVLSGCSGGGLLDGVENGGASINPRLFADDARAVSLAGGTELTSDSEELIANYNRLLARSSYMVASGILSTDWEGTTRWHPTYCGDVDCTAAFTKGLLSPDPKGSDSFRFDAVMSRNGVDLAKSVEETRFVLGGDAGVHRTLGYNGLMAHGFFGIYGHTEDYDGFRNNVSGYSLAAGDMTGNNPDFGSFIWRGVMVGGNIDFDDESNLAHFLQGDAEITLLNLSEPSLGVKFTNIRDLHNGRLHDDLEWSGLSLEHGTFAQDSPQGRIEGGFAGPRHEEVIGVFDSDNILGAFGGTLSEMQAPLDSFEGFLSETQPLLEDAAKRVAASLPRFGSVSQSSRRDTAGVTTHTVDTWLVSDPGHTADFSVLVILDNARTVIFNNLLDWRVHDPRGYDGKGTWLLMKETPGSVSGALVQINWADGDPTNYTAAGTWIHVTGDTETDRYTAAEAGSFIDGPGWSSLPPPSFPDLGFAGYRGSAEGFYTVVYGSGLEDVTPGSYESGRFSASAEFIVSVGPPGQTSWIEGCIGCEGDGLVNGVYTDAETGGDTEVIDQPAPLAVRFGRAEVDLASGAFSDNVNVFVESTGSFACCTVYVGDGSWGGKFWGKGRRHPYFPQAVAGTFGAAGTGEGGTRGALLGAFQAYPH